MTAQTITLTPTELLPHKPPMLLLTSCGTADGERVTARCTVGEQCRLFQLPDGRYGTWMLIELMAQTVGIYAGLKNRASGSAPRIGFLLGTRKFNVHTQYLAEGDVIDLSAECIFYADSGLPSQFDCRAYIAGREIASANLTVYQPESTDAWKT